MATTPASSRPISRPTKASTSPVTAAAAMPTAITGSPIASPDQIQFAPGLPKTRSGKIMRRILRKIAEDEPSSLGDTSTLADPAVVDDLVENRQNKKSAPA